MQADPARSPVPAWARARELGTVRVLALCALVILLEGFDLQAAGVSAPRLAPEFHLLPVQVGWFLGASSLGIFLASVLGGILADRFGRRPVVVAGVALFGCCSLLTLRAGGFGPLLAARFMTGMGLGLAMPAVIAMASDHSPAEWKKRAVGFIYCAIPLGALLAGAVIQSGWFGQGWRSVYRVGGLAPILAAPLLFVLLPAAAQGGGPRAETPGRFLGGLLGREHARVTLALWLGTFGTLLVIYLLLGWMPTLLVGLGLQRGQVQFIQMAFNLGASLGAAVSGLLLDRSFTSSTLSVAYLGSALCLTLFGVMPLGFHSAQALAFVVGGTVTCAQAAIFALAPLCYGRAVRTTGVGATVSAGRFGTVAGPLLAGSLLSVGKSAADVLIVLIPITLLSGLAVLLVARWSGREALT
jgi:MFS transporter, AAHS family, 3-hydroxyphenylpropionic acid transporter